MGLIIVGCEESQAIAKELRKMGHEAWSCDLKPCSGGHPEWHLQMDVFEAIKLKKWEMGVFHPDCTFLTVTGNKWFKEQAPRKSGALVGAERVAAREEAVDFFMRLVEADIPRIAIENPIGHMSTAYRKPDQVVQPCWFGDPERKATCLWLKNLPKLVPTDMVEPEIVRHKSGKTTSRLYLEAAKHPREERSRLRSVTFPGLARAIAMQWGSLIPINERWVLKANYQGNKIPVGEPFVLDRTSTMVGKYGLLENTIVFEDDIKRHSHLFERVL